jgi:AraC family transcriptional regulator
MEELKTGKFFGRTDRLIRVNEIVLTETEYTNKWVDWHYHENAYITFILEGKVFEGTKKEKLECAAGTMLFHNRQEPHYNIKPDNYTRGFHIEFGNGWLEKNLPGYSCPEGNFRIEHPGVRLLIHSVFRESLTADPASGLAIESLLAEALYQPDSDRIDKRPSWTKKAEELLRERFAEKLSLHELASILDIHPVHLSRDFKKHFNCRLSDYIRMARIERSMVMLRDKDLSLTQIAFSCGFSDQSHFIRWFRSVNGVSPLAYRRLLGRNAGC